MAKVPNCNAYIEVLANISIVSMFVVWRDCNCNDVEAFIKLGLSLTLSQTVKVILPLCKQNEECETLRQGRDSEVPRQLLCFPIQQQEAQTRVSAVRCALPWAQKLPTAGESLMNHYCPQPREKKTKSLQCVDVISRFFTKQRY